MRVAKQPRMDIQSNDCKDFKGIVTPRLASHRKRSPTAGGLRAQQHVQGSAEEIQPLNILFFRARARKRG